MKEEFRIIDLDNLYQLVYVNKYNYKCSHSSEIAYMLKIHTYDYQNILRKHSGRYYPEHDAICFRNKEDVMLAKDEIESIQLIQNIIKD